MIKTLRKTSLEFNNNLVNDFIEKYKLQNLYLYINYKKIGVSSEDTATFILIEDGDLKAVLYKYHHALQIIGLLNISDVGFSEIGDFIQTGDYNYIGGEEKLLKKVYGNLSGSYALTCGFLMEWNTSGKIDSIDYERVSVDGLDEVVDFVLTEPGYRKVYSKDDLMAQFSERMQSSDCINIVMRNDENKIVAHAATYAESEDFSVIGGVLTSPLFRNLGFGRRVVLSVVDAILSKKKKAVLYSFEQRNTEWYQRIGFDSLLRVAKIQLKS